MALTKILDTTSVGMFTLGFAITAPVIMFSNLQLRIVQATDARYEYAFSDYLGLRIVTNSMAFLIVVGICWFAGYNVLTVLVVLLVMVAKVTEATSDVIFGLFQKREQMDRIGRSYAIKGIGGLACLITSLWLTHNIVVGVAALACCWIFVLLFYDIRNVTQIDRFVPRFEWKTLRGLAWLGAPLGVVMGLISLNGNIPKYAVETYFGRDALGLFGAISYIIVGLNQVMVAIGNAATPRLAQYYINNHKAFIILLFKLLIIAGILGSSALLLAVLFGKEFLALVYTQDYAVHHDVFIWLIAVCAINFVRFVLGYAMSAARYFRAQVPLFVLVTGVTALACVFLVPDYGLKGAALAMMCGSGAQLIGASGIVLYSLAQPISQKGFNGRAIFGGK